VISGNIGWLTKTNSMASVHTVNPFFLPAIYSSKALIHQKGSDSYYTRCANSCVVECRICSCRFESRPGLLCTKVYSAFHHCRVEKWLPVIAGKAKAGMAHFDCGWTCGCAGKTVKSLENTRHIWALLQWWFTTKRHYIKCMHLYLYLYTLNY